MQRKRLPDLLKGIAVILMVQVHLVELFARQDIFDDIWGKILLFLGGPPAAPVFMAVMGYFLAFGNKGFPLSIYRGLKLILWGFLLNVGLNFHLFYHIFEGSLQVNHLEYLFGVDILFLAGLSVMIIACINTLPEKKRTMGAVVALCLTLLCTLIPFGKSTGSFSAYFLAYFGGDYHWSYFPLIPWLAYPLTGLIFARIGQQGLLTWLTGRIKLLTLLVLSTILLSTIAYAVAISHDLYGSYYHHGLLFYGWTLLFLAAWAMTWQYLAGWFGESFVFKYICWTGRNVTAFYVFQWLIIGNVATALYKTQGPGALVIWFIIIMLAVSLLVLAWRKIKEAGKKDELI